MLIQQQQEAISTQGAADEPFPETPEELEESIQWDEPDEEWLLKKVCLRHK